MARRAPSNASWLTTQTISKPISIWEYCSSGTSRSTRLSSISRATRLRPRDSYARFHLASLHAARGKPAEALPLLEAVTKEYPDYAEARVLLASVYYRLNRKADGDRERAIAQKLNAEQQAKEPGAQDGAAQPKGVKPPADPQNDRKNQ